MYGVGGVVKGLNVWCGCGGEGTGCMVWVGW